ncbi:MAG: hypothetical protein ACRYG8_53915 [Janthinobacterium lividum]
MNLIPYRVSIDLTDLNQNQQRDKDSRPGFLRRVMNSVEETASDISDTIGGLPLPLKIAAGLTAGIGIVVAAPLELAALTAAGAAAGAGAIVGSAVYLADHLINEPASEIQITSLRELDAYVPYPGQGPLLNGLYVGHPLVAKRLVKADAFHKLLEREQVAEVIRFARSHLALRSITITHRRGKSGKASAGGLANGVPVSGSASAASEDVTVLSATYDTPKKIKLVDPLIWQDTYQELAHALKDAKGGGTARLLLSHTGSFSASGNSAGIFKAQLAYLNERHLEVEVAFA